jgi:hypothetical protein
MARASRRRRRRTSRWVLLGLLLTLVTLLVSVVSSAGSDGPARRFAEQAYLDRMRPLAERSSEQGIELSRVRGQGLRLGRDAVQRQLGRVTQDAQAVLTEVERVDPPESLARARSVLVSTMVVRARVATLAQEGFAQAYGGGQPSGAIDLLTRVGEQAVAADRTYEIFLESLPADPGARSPLMPPSRWVADARPWDRAELSVFVGAVRASAIPTPVHDLTMLVATTRPPAVGIEGLSSVLPIVKAFQVEVVVANVGNSVERGVAVVATLASGSGPTETVGESVDLEPGQRRSLTLNGLNPVPAGPGTLRVVVGPVAGEANVADNERVQPVVLRGG